MEEEKKEQTPIDQDGQSLADDDDAPPAAPVAPGAPAAPDEPPSPLEAAAPRTPTDEEPDIHVFEPENETGSPPAEPESEEPEPPALPAEDEPPADEDEPEEDADDEGGEDFEPDESMSGEDLDPESLKGAVEAVLFCCDRSMSAKKLAKIIGVGDGRKVRSAIKLLQKEYRKTGRAFQIEEVAGGYQMFTLPEFHPWVKRLGKATKEERLSQAALETLAIIVYRQPILRADIEAIRGVQCGPMLRALIERGLVKVAGKSDELGRPLLYGTTKRFLEVFGLRSLRDLPQSQDLMRPGEKVTEDEEADEDAEEDTQENAAPEQTPPPPPETPPAAEEQPES